MHFSPAITRIIATEVAKALEGIEKSRDVKVKVTPKSYSTDGCQIIIEVANKSETGMAMTPEFAALEAIKPGVAGYEFDVPGHGIIKLTGYSRNRPKYPVSYTRNGKRYKGTRAVLDLCTEGRKLEPVVQ